MNALLLLAVIIALILLIVAYLDYRRASKRLAKAEHDYYERMRSNARRNH